MKPVTKVQLEAFVRKTYEGLSHVPDKCVLDPIATDAFLDALFDDLRGLLSRIDSEESETIDAEFEEVLEYSDEDELIPFPGPAPTKALVRLMSHDPDFASQDPGHPLLKGLLTQKELDEQGLDGSKVLVGSDKRFIARLRRASTLEEEEQKFDGSERDESKEDFLDWLADSGCEPNPEYDPEDNDV